MSNGVAAIEESTVIDRPAAIRTPSVPTFDGSCARSDLRKTAAKHAAAPVEGWRRVARDGLYVGGSTAIGHLLAAATSLLLRLLLDPAEMGIWQGLKVVLSYANYTNLGTSKAAARELAIARGKGDISLARRSLDLAFTFNTLTSAIYGLVVLAAAGAIAVWSIGPWRWAWCGGLVAIAALAVLQRHVTFLITLLRSLQAFAVTSQVAILEGVLTLAVAVVATWIFGLPGLCLGSLVVFLGSWYWLRAAGAPRMTWSWNSREIRQLVGVGGPLLLVGLLTSLFRSLDKLLILAFFEDREFQLGCYSLAILGGTQLTGVASMLSIVMSPRLAEMVGHADDHRAAARLAARTLELQGLIMSGAAAFMIVLVPAVFAQLLPDYMAGLTPLVLRTPGLVAFGLTLPLSGYLVAVNQQGRALVALGLAFVAAATSGAIALYFGAGLVAVALAMTLADVVQLFALAGLAFRGVLDARDWRRLLCVNGLAALPVLCFALFAEHACPAATCDWTTTMIKCLTVLILLSLCALVTYRLGNWGDAWREEAAPC